jgi:type II secretory pathway component PulF
MSDAPIPRRPPPVFGPLLYWLSLHCVLWAIWLVVMIVAVPRYNRHFQEFGIKLPENTVILLDIGDFVTEFFGLLLGAVLIALVVDAAVFVFVRQTLRLRSASVVWAGLMLLVPLCLIAFTAWGILEPMAMIQERLQGGKL